MKLFDSFRQSAAELKDLRSITGAALLLALSILLTYFFRLDFEHEGVRLHVGGTDRSENGMRHMFEDDGDFKASVSAYIDFRPPPQIERRSSETSAALPGELRERTSRLSLRRRAEPTTWKFSSRQTSSVS